MSPPRKVKRPTEGEWNPYVEPDCQKLLARENPHGPDCICLCCTGGIVNLLIDVQGGSEDDQQVNDLSLQSDKEVNSGQQEEVNWESFAAGMAKLGKELADWLIKGSPNLELERWALTEPEIIGKDASRSQVICGTRESFGEVNGWSNGTAEGDWRWTINEGDKMKEMAVG